MIYVDGALAGDVHAILGLPGVWNSYSTDITITKDGGTSTASTGKEIQLYGNGGAQYTRNFRIKCDHALIAGY